MPEPALVQPNFLMSYDGTVTDYRSAVDAAGKLVVFERAIGTSAVFNLMQIELGQPNPSPVPFAPKLDASTRPDWSWATNQVAFSNWAGIWLSQGPGTGTRLPNTAGMIYPAWYPDGQHLLVMNEQSDASPNPCTSLIYPSGKIETPVMADASLWGGMPAVDPTNSARYVFAGQKIAGQEKYDQETNYIWLVDATTSPATIRPLDQQVDPEGPFQPAYQGRAPWFSPDGNWVAFESDRNGGYAIYIQDAAGVSPAQQVLDGKWNANHAKWFPDGTTLIATVEQTPGSTPRGLATLDVTLFVSQAKPTSGGDAGAAAGETSPEADTAATPEPD